MGNYALAVGGTGTRCLEAIVHLCAAGLGPDRLFIIILDPDAAHGNIERLRRVVSEYSRIRHHGGFTAQSPIFRTEISFSRQGGKDALAWSPIRSETGLTLRQYFSYDTLLSDPTQQPLGDLCKLLYSEPELNLQWDQGFRGRASVGVPVMASVKERLDEQPWHDLLLDMKNDIGRGDSARVFVMASIFGATGASGFPTVGRILKDESDQWPEKENVRLGGVLMLPYFSFRIPASLTGIYAKPQNFLANTKAALKHYAFLWGEDSPYDALYLLGDQGGDIQEFGEGGIRQDNRPHFVELAAALAFLHFAGDTSPRVRRQYYVGRATERTIQWNDLPWEDLKTKTLYFATFALAFRAFYLPLLLDHRVEQRAHLLPWYVDHFQSRNDRLTTDEGIRNLNELSGYLRSWLEWALGLHSSTPSRTVQLLNPAALRAAHSQDFARLGDGHFRTLLHNQPIPYDAQCPDGYDELWSFMCVQEPTSLVENAVGRFATLLFNASASFCNKNYSLQV